MVLGSLEGEIPFKMELTAAFHKTKYKLDYSQDINAWLLSHMVSIIPVMSVIYLYDFDLAKASRDSPAGNRQLS